MLHVTLLRLSMLQLEEQGVLPSLTDEVQKLRDEIEQACVEATVKKHRRYRKLCDGDYAGLFLCLIIVCYQRDHC